MSILYIYRKSNLSLMNKCIKNYEKENVKK